VNEEPKHGFADVSTIQKLTRLLAAPVIEPSQRAARIQAVEKDIVLPLRLLIITILGYYFFFSGWLDTPVANGVLEVPRPRPAASRLDAVGTNRLLDLGTNAGRRTPTLEVQGPNSDLPVETNKPSPAAEAQSTNGALAAGTNKPSHSVFHITRTDNASDWTKDWSLRNASALKGSFIVYALLNLVVGAIFFRARQLTLTKIEWMVFAAGALDCVLMGTLTFLSSGFDSKLYWVFVALILHNALAIPVAFPQLMLNFLSIGAFVAGGVLYADPSINPPTTILDVDNMSHENPYERIIVLVAWSLCCYGIQVLFEKQKRAEAEATEFAVRQERLHTAGRLAAEIAHQIKNPLGIITNAAFCLHRAVHEGETAVDEQVQIIREEVDRADQIITELMGYAQLAEGKVERLEVAEELDSAVQEVFPPAAKYQVKVHRDYAQALPALLMQRRHLSGVLVNILQNAREAMNGWGEISISARYGENDSVCIEIADTGPGIAPDKIDKIFEAYFTTREKGTGLGLAIVKHNTEMYGGAVQVQSELGKGTRFVLEFPARILMRLSK
jgi:signal transduction histidine kinase